MNDFIRILKFGKPYWGKALANICFNILTAIFSLVSLTMVIPFLALLFGTQEKVYTAPELTLSSESISENFYFQITKIIDKSGETEALFFICMSVLIMFFLRNLFRYLALYFLSPIRNGIVKDLRNSVHKNVLSLPINYFTKNRKGDIIARMTTDLVEIEWSIMSSLELVFKDPLTIIIFLATLITLSPQLTLFVIILFPITGFLIARVGKSLRRTSQKGQNKMGDIVSNIEENISGLRIIKAFNVESHIHNIFKKNNERYNLIMNKLLRKKDLSSPMSEFLSTLVLICVMWFGGKIVLTDDLGLSPAQFIGYVVIFSQIIPPAKSLTSAFYRIQKGSAAAERVVQLLDEKQSISNNITSEKIKNFNTSIVFENLSFSYDEKETLIDIDFEIEKGQTVAIVGKSGSGKSTLADLISRFYEVKQGCIKIDNVNIQDYDLASLRDIMSIVSQDSILFNDTVYNNIGLGDLRANKNQIVEAAKSANAHEFIMKMNSEYQSNIGEKGDKLSGGEKQRLCIARAILKNPKILILDEATSALDAISEKQVQKAIYNLIENRTCLIIAHRISTIKNADKIIVLDNGTIVEQGSHTELLSKKGYYFNLYNAQSFE